MKIIKNGQIVTEEGILTDHILCIEGEQILKILSKEEPEPKGVKEVIDAKNGIISPGFVDIHSDYIEGVVAPRPTSLMDFNTSIRVAEKNLVNHGITTMFHSLSLCRTEDKLLNKAVRYSENVKKIMDLIGKTRMGEHLIRHRFHARMEIDNLEEVESLKECINLEKVDLISFMDHSPGQGQYRDLELYTKTIRGYREISDDAVNAYIAKCQSSEKMSMEMIRELSNLAKKKNISIASHDDDSVERIEMVESFGTSISEFPITLEVAKRARELGMHVIAGAPNVLLGGSHSGNLSAAEAIVGKSVDILCSDYYPAALLHAPFILHRDYKQDLGEMFNLVTINPARAVKMDHMIGSIKAGKKADLLIIEKLDNMPVITSVFVDGELVSKTNYRRELHGA